MGLENYTPGTIDALNVNNPTATDPKSQGDDHFRGVKTVLTETFRKSDGLTPWDTKLAVDEDDLNNGYTPIGGAIMWTGTVASIPSNWALMNGIANSAGSAVDLTGKMIIMADSDSGGTYDVGDNGGSATAGVITSTSVDLSVTDGHAITTSEMPAHTHDRFGSNSKFSNVGGGTIRGIGGGADSGSPTESEGGGAAHTHNITGGNHSHTVTLPYYALAFIERIS